MFYLGRNSEISPFYGVFLFLGYQFLLFKQTQQNIRWAICPFFISKV